MREFILKYRENLSEMLRSDQFEKIPKLVEILRKAWIGKKTIFSVEMEEA